MMNRDAYRQFATVRDVQPRGEVLHVFGDVDLAAAIDFEAAISDSLAGAKPVLVNLTRCRYLDSSGLAVLVRARKRFGARMTVLVGAKSQILRVMRIVGFDVFLNVVTELQPPHALPSHRSAAPADAVTWPGAAPLHSAPIQ